MASTVAHSMNGVVLTAPSAEDAEDKELCTQLLQIRDLVVAGKHVQFKLPALVIEQLTATLNAQDAPPVAVNGAGHATNNHQHQHNSDGPPSSRAAKGVFSALDPIFLEKSDSLVRAEGQLKRQRIERELQAQVDQRKYNSSGDQHSSSDASSRIDIDAILFEAQRRVPPMSGLRLRNDAGSETSFDENDYYSSQIQSDWTSAASSSKGSDNGADAFTADFEDLDEHAGPSFAAEPARPLLHRGASGTVLPDAPKRLYNKEPERVYGPEDEDDEYTPPDAAAFDSYNEDATIQQATPPEDDNSDYEPGEITQESVVPSPYHAVAPPAQPSPRVPVIRNHLTYLAAPQPNRVSPLAAAIGPDVELELVNGRPEVVRKAPARPVPMQSRVSTASPSANGAGGNSSTKKRRNKKRKREHEPSHRAKKRKERQAIIHSSPPPVDREPYIKREPISPPPFLSETPQAPAYELRPQQQYAPPYHMDLVSPRTAQPPSQYAPDPPRSALRYEYAPATSPAVMRVASSTAHRPVQRDTQDLRRIASMQYSQRPASPQSRIFSPVGPYRPSTTIYAEKPAKAAILPEAPSYQEVQEPVQYIRAPSPARAQIYDDAYTPRAPSPGFMPAPASRRIVVDQFGNRYYAAEPMTAPASSRASMAPVQKGDQTEQLYERTPTRAPSAYAPPQHAPPYEPTESRMAPPPPAPPQRYFAPEQSLDYVDSNGYRLREYGSRPAEPSRYAEAPTSPAYAPQLPRHERMLPPTAPLPHMPSSPGFVPRVHGVRTEEAALAPIPYPRQASVAPVQFARQDMAPPPPRARAMSVMPAADYGAPTPQQQPAYNYAPVPVPVPAPQRYVDQYGNEVFPRQVRQVSEFTYQ